MASLSYIIHLTFNDLNYFFKQLHKHEQGLVCLEAAFACGETNCDALCDLIFRLMRYPNRDKLDPIFQKYCSDYGENLWGKRKVGTIYYLCGNYLW